MQLSGEILIPAEEIQERVAELAAEITRDYEGRPVMVVAVLKGAVFFAADLMRRLDLDVKIGFLRAKSYAGSLSQERVYFTLLPEDSLHGKHVLLVEDVLDTGFTCAAILDWLREQHPASTGLCTLLDKPARRGDNVEIKADYVGFTIGDHFVVGYGLDYDERYRQLSSIYTLKES